MGQSSNNYPEDYLDEEDVQEENQQNSEPRRYYDWEF